MTRELLHERLTQATEQRDALVQRRQQLTAAREQVTAALNGTQGRVDELTELLALLPPDNVHGVTGHATD